MNLDEIIKQKLSSNYYLESRIHKVPRLGAQSYIKRDDELSFGISGNKLRKISSLLPHWQGEVRPLVLVIGSAASNHVVSCLQVFLENQIDYQLFLLQPGGQLGGKGNQAYINLLADRDKISFVSRDEWPEVQELCEDFAKSYDGPTFIMREGGCQREALPGAMTLGQDIFRNQVEHGIQFDNIFIDAGTGLSAVGLKAYLDFKKFSGNLHLVHMAPIDFDSLYQELVVGEYKSDFEINLIHHKPPTAKSFGAINQKVLAEVRRSASEDGVLVDPIYMAKLNLSVKEIVSRHDLEKQCNLMVHSGGGLSLHGFWDKLIPDGNT